MGDTASKQEAGMEHLLQSAPLNSCIIQFWTKL